ncbi:MAG TPA: PKD domain-containing protein, partial [Conexibacter sp.]|nr:PKD domain-containing protein [Conexibacter sp.]
RLAVRATDASSVTAAGVAPVATSGVKSIAVDWGDHTTEPIRRGARHAYAKPGRYKVRIVVLDRAGNRTTTIERLKITKPPRRHRAGHGTHR